MKLIYSAIKRYLEIFYNYRGRLKGCNSLLNCYGLCIAVNVLLFKESPKLNGINDLNCAYRDCLKLRIYSDEFVKNEGRYLKELNKLFLMTESKLNYILDTATKIETKMSDEHDIDNYIGGKWHPGLIATEVLDFN